MQTCDCRKQDTVFAKFDELDILRCVVTLIKLGEGTCVPRVVFFGTQERGGHSDRGMADVPLPLFLSPK